MIPFKAELTDRSGAAVELPPGAEIVPTSAWSAMALGGHDQAELSVVGARPVMRQALSWLLYRLRIIDNRGVVVWSGYIDEVEVTFGGASILLTTERLTNAVQVLYSFSSPDGGSESELTDWLVDDDSVNTWGRKEILLSAGGETSKTAAEALRGITLAQTSQPRPAITATGEAGENDGAVLRCKGRRYALDWRYYLDETGLKEQPDSGARVLLGWRMVSTEVGFVGGGYNKIAHLTGGFEDLAAFDHLIVAGTTSNNTTYTVTAGASGDAESYTANTISFEPADDIRDSADKLAFVRSREVVNITGSPLNYGQVFIDKTSAHAIETSSSYGRGGGINLEAEGASVTIAMGNSVAVKENCVHEVAWRSTTLTAWGSKVAQSFKIADGPWTAGEIAVQLWKKGTPTDDVTVALYSDSSGLPGTLLAQGTIAATDVSYNSDWYSAALTTRPALSNATTYWIVVSRNGSPDSTNFYMVGVAYDLKTDPYTDGTLKVWDGSAYQNNSTEGYWDLAFRVWAVRDITDKIADIVTAVASNYVLSANATALAGIYTRRVRDGKSTAWGEIEPLLEAGNSAGQRLLAEIDDAGGMTIYPEPYSGPLDLIWFEDGTLRNYDGTLYPPGQLPVGQWVRVAALQAADWPAGADAFLVDRASYDPRSGAWELTPKQAPDPFNLSTRQG